VDDMKDDLEEAMEAVQRTSERLAEGFTGGVQATDYYLENLLARFIEDDIMRDDLEEAMEAVQRTSERLTEGFTGGVQATEDDLENLLASLQYEVAEEVLAPYCNSTNTSLTIAIDCASAGSSTRHPAPSSCASRRWQETTSETECRRGFWRKRSAGRAQQVLTRPAPLHNFSRHSTLRRIAASM
jgi:hypothetical protein